MAASSSSYKTQVDTLFADGGERAVQERLQAEIHRTKKMEADMAAFKKKADAAKRDNVKLQETLAKATHAKESLELQLKASLLGFEQAKKAREEAVVAMAAERDQIRQRTLDEVASIQSKLAGERQVAEAMAEENATMQKEFDEKRGELEALMSKVQSDFKVRDAETRLLQERIAATKKEKDEAITERLTLLQNILLLREKKKQLGMQAELYAAKIAEFAKSVEESESVVQLGAERGVQLSERLTLIEKEKEVALQEKRKADIEIKKLRALEAAQKKRISQFEKSRAIAEGRCREAQRKAVAAGSSAVAA